MFPSFQMVWRVFVEVLNGFLWLLSLVQMLFLTALNNFPKFLGISEHLALSIDKTVGCYPSKKLAAWSLLTRLLGLKKTPTSGRFTRRPRKTSQDTRRVNSQRLKAQL